MIILPRLLWKSVQTSSLGKDIDGEFELKNVSRNIKKPITFQYLHPKHVTDMTVKGHVSVS